MSVRQVRDALVLMGSFIALIWILQVFNWADGYRLDMQFGILPHDVGRLPEIFTAPFLHFSWQHIEGNSVPLFVLGVLAAYRSIARFLIATLIIAVTSGLAVWLFQSSNELTVGRLRPDLRLLRVRPGPRASSTGTWSTSASGSSRACCTGPSSRWPSPARRGSAGSGISAGCSAACWRRGYCGRGHRPG